MDKRMSYIFWKVSLMVWTVEVDWNPEYWKMDRRGQNFVMSQKWPQNFVMTGQISWPKDWLPNSLNSFALIKIGIICWVTFWKYGRIIFFLSRQELQKSVNMWHQTTARDTAILAKWLSTIVIIIKRRKKLSIPAKHSVVCEVDQNAKTNSHKILSYKTVVSGS